jgi:hypothetical protein
MEYLEENVKINATEKMTDVSAVSVGRYTTEDLTLCNAIVLQRSVCAEHFQLEYNYTR